MEVYLLGDSRYNTSRQGCTTQTTL
jgi:hypothetical protein